jgi:hypothetical protein
VFIVYGLGLSGKRWSQQGKIQLLNVAKQGD